jgi:uncharacterized protein (DUF58 family)
MAIGSPWRLALFVLVWAAAGGLGYVQGGYAPWFVFDAMTAALALGAAIRFGALRRVEVRHEIAAVRLLEGEEQTVTVRLKHRSFVPVPWLLLEEEWKGSGEAAVRTHRKLLFPWFRTTLEYRYTLAGLPRGEYRLARLTAVAGDGIGLGGRRKPARLAQGAGGIRGGLEGARGGAETGRGEAGSAGQSMSGEAREKSGGEGVSFVAYPRETPLQLGALRGADEEGRPLPGAFPASGGGAPTGLRDYAAGDPLGHMHWKATARRGTLTVKEPEPHEAQQVLLLLDTSAATYAALGDRAPEALESSVRAAAGLLRACGERGWALAFACCDAGAPIAGGSGLRGRELLLERLARVDGKGAVRFADAVAGEAARLPTAVRLALVTPCVDEPLLAALRSLQRPRSNVLLALPHAMPTLAVRERERLAALRALGCAVLPLAPAPLPPRAPGAAGRAADAAPARGGAGHVHAGA